MGTDSENQEVVICPVYSRRLKPFTFWWISRLKRIVSCTHQLLPVERVRRSQVDTPEDVDLPDIFLPTLAAKIFKYYQYLNTIVQATNLI